MLSAEDVQRQVTVAAVIAMEEPTFLLSVHKIAGCIQIQPDRPAALLLKSAGEHDSFGLTGRRLRLFRAERCGYNFRIVAGDVELTLSCR